MITMKLKLNLLNKLDYENKRAIVTIIDVLGYMLFIVAVCYSIYWCLTS